MSNNITNKIQRALALWGIVLLTIILTAGIVLSDAIKNKTSPLESLYYWVGMFIIALLSGYASYLTEIYFLANYCYGHKERSKFLWLILGTLFMGTATLATINNMFNNVVVNIFCNFLGGVIITLTIPSLLGWLLGWLLALWPLLPKRHN